MFVNKSSLLITVFGEDLWTTISAWSCVISFTSRVRLAVVCRADRVVCNSSYCKVMQCETSCRRSIVQCENNSDWMIPQIVVQCENSSDPMTLKIVQCELDTPVDRLLCSETGIQIITMLLFILGAVHFHTAKFLNRPKLLIQVTCE